MISSYNRCKNIVRRRLLACFRVLCEECCLNRPHVCVIDEFHIIHHFDAVFIRRQSAEKYRLRILEDLLFECIGESEPVIVHLFRYQAERPWVFDIESNKENSPPPPMY